MHHGTRVSGALESQSSRVHLPLGVSDPGSLCPLHAPARGCYIKPNAFNFCVSSLSTSHCVNTLQACSYSGCPTALGSGYYSHPILLMRKTSDKTVIEPADISPGGLAPTCVLSSLDCILSRYVLVQSLSLCRTTETGWSQKQPFSPHQTLNIPH